MIVTQDKRTQAMTHNPVFDATLRAFGGAAYANVQALQTHTTIRVEKVEITLPHDNTCHPEVYRTGYASDAVLAQAYEMLAERHMQELYDLCCELTEKKA